jgi:hypothetical protein
MKMKIYYDAEDLKGKKVLKKANYNGVIYSIVTCGSHPCCYLHLDKCSSLYGVGYWDIFLEVHGGLTYSEMEEDYWVIGWDFAHSNDYFRSRIVQFCDNPKKWTFKELEQECKNAIDQLKSLRRFVKGYYFAKEKCDYY